MTTTTTSLQDVGGYVARTSALLASLETLSERLEDQCRDPQAFPLITAMQACVESAQRSCEAADTALSEAMRAAG